jgi:hypothetical protein
MIVLATGAQSLARLMQADRERPPPSACPDAPKSPTGGAGSA